MNMAKQNNCPHCNHLITLCEVKLFLSHGLQDGLNLIDCPHCEKTIMVWLSVELTEVSE